MNKIKINYFFYFIVIAVFIIINILIFFLLSSHKKNNTLLLQYESEQILNNLLEAARNDKTYDFLKENKNILAFGIYDSEGSVLISYGNIPVKLDIRAFIKSGNPFSINRINKTAELFRPFGSFQSPHGIREFHKRRMMFTRILKIAYIKFDIKDFQSIYQYKNYRFPIFSLISIFMMSIFIFIYRKMENYKNKYEEQSHLARLGEASRTIAHEIKNPLSSIKINLSYLKKKMQGEYSDEIKAIDDDVERIRHTTDKVRDFLNDPIGNPELIEIDSFIRNLLMKFGFKITYANKLVKKCYIKIDPEKLRSIIENLINNAVESSAKNNKNSIEILLNKEKNMCAISVMDRGKGLEKDYENKIFDPFYTTKPNGFGLGLSLAKRFIEASDGKIIISPREDEGVKADIYFKIEAVE